MDETSAKSFETQLRKGLLSYSILSLAARQEIYTGKIINILKQADMIVTEGTLYPLLNRLSKEGYLDHRWKESSGGPPKKYYKASALGKNYLNQLDQAWKNISNSINKIIKTLAIS